MKRWKVLSARILTMLSCKKSTAHRPMKSRAAILRPRCIGCDLKVVSGNPDPTHVSASYVERQNLSMRMGMRRFTRLTNGFSKKVDNHRHMIALYFLYYNFCRVHSTLRVTPAMEAGISAHIWGLEEMCALLPEASSASKRIDKGAYPESTRRRSELR
jgi:hypothetical protein